MKLDDRFMGNQCSTCGVVITSGADTLSEKNIQRHNDWHNSQERLREIIVAELDLPRGILNWD